MKPGLWALLLLVGAVQAQDLLALKSQTPDAPNAHGFWSLENKVGMSIFAVQLTADAITTQIGLNRGFREVNPVLRPLVKRGASGEVAATVLGFGTGLGAVYLLHATHHYRAERITLRLILAGEGAMVGHNIAALH